MEATVFDSGDAPYMKWMERHPEGYVLNTRRTPYTTYVVLHRSGCSHIASIKTGKDDGFTARDYIKVCAEEPQPIVDWVKENRRTGLSSLRPCGSCEPEVEETGLYKHPAEEAEPETYEEGATALVEVNRHERSKAARRACLKHYGAECQVCGLRFEERYGEIGEGFIEVHHEVPLSETDGTSEVDPIEDLKPVCPNCHAMLHQKTPPLTIEELRDLLRTDD